MKDFDIEKIERKNIYKTPENFFAAMQAKVLQQTVPQKKARIINLNWAYAAAAAVATIFGITFFVNQREESTEVLAKSQEVNKPENVLEQQIPQPQNEATIAYQTFADDLTSVSSDNQKANEATHAVVASAKTEILKKPKAAAPSPEGQVDQILANITSAELADLGRNTEQDVYLDLYY